MRALVVGCLPFLHLAQVHSQGDLRHRTVDFYLIERVSLGVQPSCYETLVITEGITVNRWMHSRDERGMPEEYVRLDDRRWRRVQGIIVVDILQLEYLGRMNG